VGLRTHLAARHRSGVTFEDLVHLLRDGGVTVEERPSGMMTA
jgi:hypothetical protein